MDSYVDNNKENEEIIEEIQDEAIFKNFISENCVFLVDVKGGLQEQNNSAKNNERKGFSKVDKHRNSVSANRYHRNKVLLHKNNDMLERKRKEKSKVNIGIAQELEKMKQQHKQVKSKQAKLRMNYWSSYKFAVQPNHNRMLKPSVDVESSWKTVEQFENTNLLKATVSLTSVKESVEGKFGVTPSFNETMKSVCPSRKVVLNKDVIKTTVYPSIRPVLDPVMVEMAQKNEGDVFITSKALGMIMSCCRSVQSWDLKFVKRNKQIFVDYTNGGRVDEITTDETSRTAPPISDKKGFINSSQKLRKERTMINLCFSKQILVDEENDAKKEIHQQLPVSFTDKEKKVLPRSYVYKKFSFPGSQALGEMGPLSVVVRCEVDSLIMEGERKVNCLNRAVHEYMVKKEGQWDKLLESNVGTVIVDEVYNNSFEFSRWIFEALLADCKYLNIGFVTRKSFSSDAAHEMIGLEREKTLNMSNQFGVKLNNGWGIFLTIIQSMMGQEDGNYILLKIPNKQCLCSYKVPAKLGTSQKVEDIPLLMDQEEDEEEVIDELDPGY